MKLKPIHWVMLGVVVFIFLLLALCSTVLLYKFFAPTPAP
jgi:hypothetical protein